jgi:hypothetical protein
MMKTMFGFAFGRPPAHANEPGTAAAAAAVAACRRNSLRSMCNPSWQSGNYTVTTAGADRRAHHA